MKKNSWIRTEEDRKCPFGLPIISACKNAGNSVANMCPLKEVDKEKFENVEIANKRIYIYYKTNNRCLYASNIMEKHNAVNCDFGDTAAGMKTPTFEGSPMYVQTFTGVGLNGFYAFPLGFYADYAASRNLFQGLFSLLGSETNEIIKIGVNKLFEKISNNEPLSKDEQFKLLDILKKCKENYEEKNISNEKIYELIQLWSPRQT